MKYYMTEKEAQTIKDIMTNGLEDQHTTFVKLGDSRVHVKALYGKTIELDCVKSYTVSLVLRPTKFTEDVERGQKYIRFYDDLGGWAHFDIFDNYVVRSKDEPPYMSLNEQSQVEKMLNNEIDKTTISSLHGWSCIKKDKYVEITLEGISIMVNRVSSTGKKRIYFENDAHGYIYFATKPEVSW